MRRAFRPFVDSLEYRIPPASVSPVVVVALDDDDPPPEPAPAPPPYPGDIPPIIYPLAPPSGPAGPG